MKCLWGLDQTLPDMTVVEIDVATTLLMIVDLTGDRHGTLQDMMKGVQKESIMAEGKVGKVKKTDMDRQIHRGIGRGQVGGMSMVTDKKVTIDEVAVVILDLVHQEMKRLRESMAEGMSQDHTVEDQEQNVVVEQEEVAGVVLGLAAKTNDHEGVLDGDDLAMNFILGPKDMF